MQKQNKSVKMVNNGKGTVNCRMVTRTHMITRAYAYYI